MSLLGRVVGQLQALDILIHLQEVQGAPVAASHLGCYMSCLITARVRTSPTTGPPLHDNLVALVFAPWVEASISTMLARPS